MIGGRLSAGEWKNCGQLITAITVPDTLKAPLCSPRRPTMTTLDSQPSVFSAESYFGTQLPPPTLDSDIAGVRSFVHRQRDLGRKVVLVTVSVALAPSLHAQNLILSQEWRDNRPVGAQRVSMRFCPYAPTWCLIITPLRTSRVRFLDNFSAGGLLARASIVSRFLNGLSSSGQVLAVQHPPSTSSRPATPSSSCTDSLAFSLSAATTLIPQIRSSTFSRSKPTPTRPGSPRRPQSTKICLKC